MAGVFQIEDLGQDFSIRENQPKACKRQDEYVQDQRILQIRQMKILKALTPLSNIHEQKTELHDLPLLHTTSTFSDMTEPPSSSESIQANSRYKDVSDIISLFQHHDSDSDSNDGEGYLSDGSKLSSILKYTHIFGKV